MSAEGFAAFRVAVLHDRRLQAELLSVPDRSRFVAAVVDRARAGGWDVRPEDVQEALRAAREVCHLRWI